MQNTESKLAVFQVNAHMTPFCSVQQGSSSTRWVSVTYMWNMKYFLVLLYININISLVSAVYSHNETAAF